MVAGLPVVAADIDGQIAATAGFDALTAVAAAMEMGAVKTGQPLARNAGTRPYTAYGPQLRDDLLLTAGKKPDTVPTQGGGHVCQDRRLGVQGRILENDPDPARAALHLGVEVDKACNAFPDSQTCGGDGNRFHLVQVVTARGGRRKSVETEGVETPVKRLRPEALHQFLELLQSCAQRRDVGLEVGGGRVEGKIEEEVMALARQSFADATAQERPVVLGPENDAVNVPGAGRNMPLATVIGIFNFETTVSDPGHEPVKIEGRNIRPA